MDSREVLLRLIYRAFIDIRSYSRDGDSRVTGGISNLIHNIPLAMLSRDDDGVLVQLKQRAEVLGMSSWLETALGDIFEAEKPE